MLIAQRSLKQLASLNASLNLGSDAPRSCQSIREVRCAFRDADDARPPAASAPAACRTGRERAMRMHLAVRDLSRVWEEEEKTLSLLWEPNRTEPSASRPNGANHPTGCAITRTMETEQVYVKDSVTPTPHLCEELYTHLSLFYTHTTMRRKPNSLQGHSNGFNSYNENCIWL